MPTEDWRPSATPAVAQRRARLLTKSREFFAARNVLEVDTPALSPAAVSDPHIDSIEARLGLRAGQACFLRTSPEFAMKRLLCAGYPDIFEIAKVFRDNEAGPAHQPEFTLIEWYRRDFTLRQIMDETVALLDALIEPRYRPAPAAFRSYRDAFRQFAGLDPLSADLDELRAAGPADERLHSALGERKDDWLDLILTTRVAPAFGRNGFTVLYHYPESQAALARYAPGHPEVAERFEVFLGEMELANGFVELQDASEQARRFARDQAARRELDKVQRPLDEKLLAALAAGLPDCAGVAVGLDRVLMINEATGDISTVMTFCYDEAR